MRPVKKGDRLTRRLERTEGQPSLAEEEPPAWSVQEGFRTEHTEHTERTKRTKRTETMQRGEQSRWTSPAVRLPTAKNPISPIELHASDPHSAEKTAMPSSPGPPGSSLAQIPAPQRSLLPLDEPHSIGHPVTPSPHLEPTSTPDRSHPARLKNAPPSRKRPSPTERGRPLPLE